MIMKFLVNELVLAYPPISRQMGEWLEKDKKFREYVKPSKLFGNSMKGNSITSTTRCFPLVLLTVALFGKSSKVTLSFWQ